MQPAVLTLIDVYGCCSEVVAWQICTLPFTAKYSHWPAVSSLLSDVIGSFDPELSLGSELQAPTTMAGNTIDIRPNKVFFIMIMSPPICAPT